MLDRINGWGNRWGWGVMIAAAPFVNAVAAITSGLACFALLLFFSLFNIYPAPPADSGNPISWALYFLCGLVYGWFIWSQILFFFLIPLGMAWSLADLLSARAKGDSADRTVGATAGLALTLTIIALYWRASGQPRSDYAGLQRAMRQDVTAGPFAVGDDYDFATVTD